MIRHDTFTVWANYTDDLKTKKETKKLITTPRKSFKNNLPF